MKEDLEYNFSSPAPIASAADSWVKHNANLLSEASQRTAYMAFCAGNDFAAARADWKEKTKGIDAEIDRMANHPNPPKPVTVYFGRSDMNPSLARDMLKKQARDEEIARHIATMSDECLNETINVFCCMDQWKHSTYASALRKEKQRRERDVPKFASCGMCALGLEPIPYVKGDWALCGTCVARLCAGGTCDKCFNRYTVLYGDFRGPRYCRECYQALAALDAAEVAL